MKGGKKWLTYEEQLNRKEMTKKKIMIELMRELMMISILIGYILDHIFDLKKDNLICFIFVFDRGMSNGICDLIVYLKSEG